MCQVPALQIWPNWMTRFAFQLMSLPIYQTQRPTRHGGGPSEQRRCLLLSVGRSTTNRWLLPLQNGLSVGSRNNLNNAWVNIFLPPYLINQTEWKTWYSPDTRYRDRRNRSPFAHVRQVARHGMSRESHRYHFGPIRDLLDVRICCSHRKRSIQMSSPRWPNCCNNNWWAAVIINNASLANC